MPGFALGNEPADGLAPSGARPSAGAMICEYTWVLIDMWLGLKGLNLDVIYLSLMLPCDCMIDVYIVWNHEYAGPSASPWLSW